MPDNLTSEDLINELNQQTENAGADHFEGAAASADQPASQEPVFDTPDPNRPVDQDPPVPPVSKEKLRDMAGRWINFFNTALKMLLKPLYQISILEKGDVEAVKNYKAQNPNLTDKQLEDAVTPNHELYPVLNRMDKFLKAVDSIELTADEKESLKQPLADVIEKYRKLQLSPEWTLAIAVVLVIIPRLDPLFSFKKLFKTT